MKLPNLKMLSVPPGPGHGGFAGGHKRGQNRYQPFSTEWKSQDTSKASGNSGKDIPAWKTFGGAAGQEVEDAEDQLAATPEAVVCPLSKTETHKTVDFQTSVNYSGVSHVPFATKKCKAAAKERLKSSIKESRNKVCELCFFCRSVCFCPICSHCPQCCSCSLSRRLPSAFLAELGPSGCKSESGVNFEGGLFAPIQTQTPSSTIPPDSQWLCTPQRNISLKRLYKPCCTKRQ